eukprot:3695464-Prymnesium_polylepis.2
MRHVEGSGVRYYGTVRREEDPADGRNPPRVLAQSCERLRALHFHVPKFSAMAAAATARQAAAARRVGARSTPTS